jgi:hypothetical protein
VGWRTIGPDHRERSASPRPGLEHHRIGRWELTSAFRVGSSTYDDVAMRHIDRVWARIKANAGLEFRTVTGLPFTYEVPGNYLRVSRTVRNLSRSNFQKALELVPAEGPGQLRGRQGASYTWAILMDPRIRQDDW